MCSCSVEDTLETAYGSEKPSLTSAAMRWMHHHSQLKVPTWTAAVTKKCYAHGNLCIYQVNISHTVKVINRTFQIATIGNLKIKNYESPLKHCFVVYQ